MLADAVVSYAEVYRDRKITERMQGPETHSLTAQYRRRWARALRSIRFAPVSKNGCYGLKATAHPSLAGEVADIIDAVTKMSGHIQPPIMRTDAAVLFRWQWCHGGGLDTAE